VLAIKVISCSFPSVTVHISDVQFIGGEGLKLCSYLKTKIHCNVQGRTRRISLSLYLLPLPEEIILKVLEGADYRAIVV
jgi:hypothetical protein